LKICNLPALVILHSSRHPSCRFQPRLAGQTVRLNETGTYPALRPGDHLREHVEAPGRYAGKESTMPYALFEKDDQLSRSFPTLADAWEHADNAGLVVDDNGKQILEDDYTIKPCSADPTEDRQADDWRLPKYQAR
jgi:hypothetical protein